MPNKRAQMDQLKQPGIIITRQYQMCTWSKGGSPSGKWIKYEFLRVLWALGNKWLCWPPQNEIIH